MFTAACSDRLVCDRYGRLLASCQSFFFLDRHYFCSYAAAMTDKAAAIEAIRERADKARTPIYKVCERAEVSPANMTKWRNDPSVARWSTIGRLEDALTVIERERAGV